MNKQTRGLLIFLAGAVMAGALLAAQPESPVVASPTKGSDGYWRIAFSNLISFDFQIPGGDSFTPLKPAPGRKDGIPAEVRDLDGRRVRILGYMLPLAVDRSGSATELLIMRDVQTCCYGATPQPTEWIVVKIGSKGPKVKPIMDTPLVFLGTLHVGEIYRDNQFEGIYELDLDKVTNP